MNVGVITTDLVPPEWLQRNWVVLVQNWPQVCSRMALIPPDGEKKISTKNTQVPARHLVGNVTHLAKSLPVPAQPARWLKTHRYSQLSENDWFMSSIYSCQQLG